MILCSCCVIRQDELRAAVRALITENPKAPVTLNRVYRHLGRKPDCMDCSPLLTRRISMISADIIVREDILRGQDIPRRLK
ncbi:hypothetical protein [Nitratireductor sp. XY-223]|uniref:hypothetical protein n=1 Tax=Nitratireductor sp. XY-223 TaxID=2561926 RepID=UPI0010AA633B|nr:hypothetical protein [Nitratireductor sp. XY-223]